MATDQIKTIIYAAADAKARVQSKFFFKLSKQPGFKHLWTRCSRHLFLVGYAFVQEMSLFFACLL
jgi:hypothetical protein